MRSCQEIEVNHQMVEIEVRQKEEEQMRKEGVQYNIKIVLDVNVKIVRK